MIIRFSVENFRSYKKKNTLDFVSSSKILSDPEHERRFGRLSIIKNVGIFGSNAFGKSNILNALGAMANLVTNGRCHENLSFIDSPEKPTLFDIVFLTDDDKFYEYSFEIKKENIINPYSIVNEELHQLFLNGSSELIYSKKDGLQNIHDDALSYYCDGYKNINSQLFLKYINAPERFVSNDPTSVLLRKIYSFFATNIIVKLDETPMIFLINKDNIEKVTNFLKRYDIGIKSAHFVSLNEEEISKIINQPIFELIRNEFQKNSKLKEQYFSDGNDIYVVFLDGSEYKMQKLVFNHKGILSQFSYGYESNGTQRIFTLLALLFDKNNKNKTIAIDEIEKSSFVGIASTLIKDFQEEFKDTNAQLVFTSHLNSLISDVLRKDEVFFVDKNAFGESSLYPLSDFKPATRTNVEKQYLEGSYGAIPKIGVKLSNGSSN